MDDRRLDYRMVIPKDPAKDTKLFIDCKYRDLHLSLSWDESGTGYQHMEEFLAYVPKVIAQCREERQVRLDVSGMDAEIDDLLGDQ